MDAALLSVGKSVLSGALDYSKSAFAEEVALQLGVQRDQAFIVDELEMMQSFMMEAHKDQDDNEVVKTWVKQVRDMAYDAEDCLQDFVVRMEKRSWWQFPRTLLERRRVANQLKELRDKVEDVSQRNLRYRLVKGASSTAATTAEQSTFAVAATFSIDYARRASKHDNQTVDLVQLINKQEANDLKVIAVWGTSGNIGQTTIIRMAYENPDVQTTFPCRAWVRVMHPFSPSGFMQSLVNQFQVAYGVDDMLETENTVQDLAQKFKGYVNENRYLIVLNDLCAIEEWDEIKRCFPNKKKLGSRIIVSTTQVEVARLCAGLESQAFKLELDQLSDQTLYAFHAKASQEEISHSLSTVSNREAATSHARVAVEIIKGDLSVALEESQLIGRKKEIHDIVKLLISRNSQRVEVISVWGMGGLGKTALVNSVYKSPKLSDKFEKFVFVTIMRPFNLAELLETLVVRLDQGSFAKAQLLDNRVGTKKSLPTMSVEELIEELKRLVNMKSCLIVLDDVSSISEWDQISPFLVPHLKETSRIIVTTRKNDIAEHCSGIYDNVYNLKVLDPDDALHLFRKKVFGYSKDIFSKNPMLVEEEKQILKQCNGVPSAIVVIGGYLAEQPKTPKVWRKLNENISAEVETNPELGVIRIVLNKGYDSLPKHLKFCFFYLTIFPKDYNISRRRLIRRWAAEGYSSEASGNSAIEMADRYFMVLKDRSLISTSHESVHSRKSVDYCRLHNIIREIATSKSMEENLVFRLEEGCSLNTHNGLFRHLAISRSWKGDQSEFEHIEGLSRIRSLTIFENYRPFFISDKMRFLRVLDFEGTSALGYHDLDHIGKLLHLKYLSLRGCDGIHLLPDSLGNLRQLQTLDIRNTNISTLPKTTIKLQKLQYIHAGRKLTGYEYADVAAAEAGGSTTGCAQLLSSGLEICTICCKPCGLPPAIMRGIYENGGVIVPRGIRKLKDLHTLREVNVGRGNDILRDIGMLKGLRKLGVSGINKKNGHAFCSAISNLSRLESLSVSSAGNSGLCGCLDALSSPPENLQSLKLYGNLEKIPEWIKELQHLVKLKLVGTRLLEHYATMELLGKLPKLEILLLLESWSSFLCEELEFKSLQGGIAFRSLRVLTLKVTRNIKSVKFEEPAMPKLELLQFTGKVNSEIEFSGLGFLPSINEVQVRVSFLWDSDRILAAPDPETRDKIIEEEIQEERRKEGELKKKIQEQLAQNANEPIFTTE